MLTVRITGFLARSISISNPYFLPAFHVSAFKADVVTCRLRVTDERRAQMKEDESRGGRR